jgi:hypothetical protein
MDGSSKNLRPLSTERLQDLYKKYRVEFNDSSIAYAQYFKVELSNLSYEEVLRIFNSKNLEDLTTNFIFIADIDFTKDFRCSFDKKLND